MLLALSTLGVSNLNGISSSISVFSTSRVNAPNSVLRTNLDVIV
jgi:hypothetical protein